MHPTDLMSEAMDNIGKLEQPVVYQKLIDFIEMGQQPYTEHESRLLDSWKAKVVELKEESTAQNLGLKTQKEIFEYNLEKCDGSSKCKKPYNDIMQKTVRLKADRARVHNEPGLIGN